jgi:hypothetical protein
MNRALRVKILEPLCGLSGAETPATYPVAPDTYGALDTFFSVDGSTVSGSSSIYVLGLNPMTMPFVATATSTTTYTGAAFADGVTLSNLCQGFSKYRVHSMALHWRPTASSVSPVRIGLAVTRDASQPQIGVPSLDSALYPNMSTLESCTNSIFFAAWLPWSQQFEVDTSEKYMTFNGLYLGPGNGAYPEADIRQSCFGAITALINQESLPPSGTGHYRFGTLYWELDLELIDPTFDKAAFYLPAAPPTRLGGRAVGSLLQRRAEMKDSKESKEIKDLKRVGPAVLVRSPVHGTCDDDEESEPEFTPHRHAGSSSVPGGSLYRSSSSSSSSTSTSTSSTTAAIPPPPPPSRKTSLK